MLPHSVCERGTRLAVVTGTPAEEKGRMKPLRVAGKRQRKVALWPRYAEGLESVGTELAGKASS